MSKLNNAIYEIHSMDELATKNCWINNINPTVKLILTIIYISIVVSFNKYNLSSLMTMTIYPIIIFSTNDISFKDSLKRLKIVLPLVCFVGVFNPFFDREILIKVGEISISKGMMSMITLMIKGILTSFATYLLIITTNIEKICYAMGKLHIPKIFITQVLFIYRYITVLLDEANQIIQAYSLRAPNQKGIQYKVWGSLIGQLLLRTMDKADNIYESMCLRGYVGEFYYVKNEKTKGKDYVYLISWLVVFIIIRVFNLIEIIGSVFG